MKNSIFNAVGKMRYLTLLVVLILTCGNVWATTFTTTSSGGFSNGSKTIDGITVTFAKGLGTAPSWQSGHIRVYESNTISFSSSSTIVSITMTATGSSYAKKFTPSAGNFSVSGTTMSWEGSATDLTLTLPAGSAQARITKIVVTTGSTKTLSSIAITEQPTRRKYVVGETFSSSGAVVTATYSDASTKSVSATWTPTSALTAGTGQTVTASYTEGGTTKTATTTIDVYSITLNAKDESDNVLGAGVVTQPTQSGSSLTAEATGNSYTFKQWSVSGVTLSDNTSTTPTITDVTGAVTATAVYYAPITVEWYAGGTKVSNETHARGWSLMYPSNPNPTTYGCTGKEFYGWTTEANKNYEHATDAPSLVSSGTAINENSKFYAVFAESSGGGGVTTTWVLTELSAVTEGTYALLTDDGHAFNGEFNKGHGQITAQAFSFTDGVANSAPTGTCEVTFAAVTGGFTMHIASGYLYASKAASGGFGAKDTDTEHWSYTSSNWQYSKNYSGSYAKLRSYSNTTFRTYSNNSGALLKLAKKTASGSEPTYTNFATSCGCEEYSFHTGSSADETLKTANTQICFDNHPTDANQRIISNYVIPSDTKFFVGKLGYFYNSNLNISGTGSQSVIKQFGAANADNGLYLNYTKGYGDGSRPRVGQATGAIGTLYIDVTSTWHNLHLGFDPNGYIFKLGSTYLTMHNATSGLDATRYKETDVVTLSSTNINGQFQVNIAAAAPNASTGVACAYTETKNLTTMGVKSGSGNNWRGTTINAGADTDTKGFFRIDIGEGNATNWNAHWVPCYELTFNLKGGSGSIATTPAYVSCEGDAAARTVTIPNTAPTKSGYRFMGWSDTDGGGVNYAAGSTHNVTLSENKTVYAVWKQEFTVTYAYAGGSGSCAGGSYIEGETVTVCASTPTKDGSTFKGWSYSPSVTVTAGTFPMPASNVTITATWQDTEYELTHNGSNYTNTENKTRIKSGDTPLTLNYTCTGTYGFPNDVTISGGGKGSWTKDTHYTWTVAGDKQSARLVINETTITANVSITITMSTLYTVTFVHHSKGTYSDGSTEWSVRSDENVITLPTVTDVSCGFYDTFEGWIASGSEYNESTSKPATVYAGGSSYTVNSNVTLRALYSKCEGAGGSVYQKVTTDPGDWSGTYLIINETYNKAMNGSETQANLVTTSNNVAVTINNSQVVSNLTTDTYAFTIAPHSTANGKYSICSYSGYYIGSNSTSNTINATATETTYSNAISISDGVLTIGCGKFKDSDPSKEYRLMFMGSGAGSPIFKYYPNTQGQVCLYKKQSLCTKYYATNPSCVKPTGVHITYNANGGEMTCSNQDKTYKVIDEENQYPQLASVQNFCTRATRDGYTLVGWNTQANGLGTTYNINQHYYNLPVSGELDGGNWVTLNLYAMWAPAVSFDLGNAAGGTGVPAVVEADGGFMLPAPTDEQLGVIPCGYSFYGWSESSVVATNTKPALFMPGTKYTGGARTLYAVYRLAGGGGNDQYYFTFEVNSKTYCITGKHANYDRFVVEETTTGLEFGLDNGYLYYMDNDAKVYVYWAGSGTTVTTTSVMPNNNNYKTSFVDGVNGTTVITPATSGRYLQFTDTGGSYDYYDRAYYTTGGTNPILVEATSYTYATNPSCETTATLAFVTNGGTLNYPDTYDENSYVDLRVGTNVYLPTATYAGEWEFEGWMKGSELPSQDYSPEGMSNFYTVTLNTTTYSAAPAGTTTFYAIFSKTVNDNQFDPVNGGTYKLFAIMADGTKKYMPTWDGTQTTLSPVTSCASTGDYTITPGTGEHAGQYKITHGTYTLGVKGEGDTQFKNDANAWWDIEPSTSGKGTWRIKIHGSSTRCMALSGTGSFSNSIISGFVNSPSQPAYRDMEIGECIYTEYTSTPENIPYITITGSPVKITSTNGERVYAPTKIHIEAHNFSTTRTIHFAATNGFATNPASVNTGANGAYSGDIEIYYQPTTDGDGSIVSSVLTASQIAGPAAEKVSQTFSAIRGRNMPANFVIAAKVGEQWYAMPDDCRSSGTPAGVPIEVNDPNAPTAASLVPHNVEWRLSDVVNSNSRPKDKVYFYEPNSTNDYTLYAGAAPSIQTNAQLSNVTGGNSNNYEWGLTTTDLCAYTISNANVGKNISINTSGNFGTHAANIASSTLYLLPITAYYETAQMQVLEWKANSVVIMYTGTQATATTKVGDNSASSAQTLSSQKLTHGIYELTTSQALTANAGQPLKVSFGGGAEIAIVTIPIIINSAVTANADHASEDVIIVSGGKLTAAATKYNFRNIYVYGGGKLKIASGSQLGVNNIILRAGGVTTNGSGGNATYAYVYPQVELGGELSSTQTNIKYEYVTDYDHWYHLCLPFNATLTSIHYPQEYYGSNVRADNSGSWIIKRYDGATRATGDYNAWKDIENDSPAKTEVTAGVGYIFWGAPKKVIIGGDQQRQAWGIQRMTMAITSAAAATTAETNDKNISVDSYRNVNNPSNQDNDRGWNLVGNPYMVNLTGLSSESLIAGQLVHTETVPWDGKWRNNGDGVRYVTIPDNHFDSYVAKTAFVASGDGDFMPGRAFFVQITEGASTLTFAAANRASLTPARFAQTTQTVDIETGIVMSDKSKHDEVNFWIKEDKSAEYEYNADYPKTPNKTNFNIYGVHQSGNLSWVAISPAIAEGDMAIGYQVPAAGDYTLSLSEKYIAEEIESVFVTDHGVSPELTTDLMVNTYTFTVHQAETNNERFTVSIKVREEDNIATDIGNSTVDTHAVKFIRDDKMYILRNGLLYDATGKRVNGINK